MALLRSGQRLQPFGDLREALVAGHPGEARVHLGGLVDFAGDRRAKVVFGGADGLTGSGISHLGQEVEVPERMAGGAVSDRTEQRSNLGIALDVGLLGEVEVTPIGLAFDRKRFLQVLFGFSALEFRHGCRLGWVVG